MVLFKVLFMVLCATCMTACQFGGYVPKGTHQPVAEEERNIADLAFDTLTRGELNCTEGLCRVRHRLRVTLPGMVDITVAGPRGKGTESGLTGPRLARAVLQDVYGRPLARNDPESTEGDMVFSSPVSDGPHFILIQGLGGLLEYELTATFTPGPDAAPTAASNTGVPGLHAPDRGGSLTDPRAVPGASGAGGQKPGDVSDGADFAYDPAADLRQMRTYAFAENPEAQLDGSEVEDRGNPFVIRQIQRLIRYALADEGLQQVDAAEADFLIGVQVGSQSTTWYSMGNVPHSTSYDSYFDRWRSVGAFVTPHTYVDGTLIIDFIDPKSEELFWHGWTTEPVNVKLDDENLLKGAVHAVLAQFEPS